MVAAYQSWYVAIFLGMTVGPYFDAAILVAMHELSHNLCTGSILYDRLISLVINIPMLFPISEIFRQHHTAHHLHLGDAKDDVDAPCDWEVKFVGNSAWKKAIWLTFNMVFLPIRSLHKVEVRWNRFVVLNWLTSLSFALCVVLVSFKAAVFLFISLLMSQGAHPANARQLQRHFWDGSDDKALKDGSASFTFSFYGWSNALFLNVGYHNEHHDFHRVAWTRLPELKRIAGDKYYPDTGSYKTRGMNDVVNFIFNPKVTLANFYSQERGVARTAHFAKEE